MELAYRKWLHHKLRSDNPVIKSFYQRLLANGKLKIGALTACIRKLLVILNAMVKNGQDWSPTIS